MLFESLEGATLKIANPTLVHTRQPHKRAHAHSGHDAMHICSLVIYTNPYLVLYRLVLHSLIWGRFVFDFNSNAGV